MYLGLFLCNIANKVSKIAIYAKFIMYSYITMGSNKPPWGLIGGGGLIIRSALGVGAY